MIQPPDDSNDQLVYYWNLVEAPEFKKTWRKKKMHLFAPFPDKCNTEHEMLQLFKQFKQDFK